jgi:hypothetical protein
VALIFHDGYVCVKQIYKSSAGAAQGLVMGSKLMMVDGELMRGLRGEQVLDCVHENHGERILTFSVPQTKADDSGVSSSPPRLAQSNDKPQPSYPKAPARSPATPKPRLCPATPKPRLRTVTP